ncbi:MULTISPECIES: hypothetical protein [Bacillaceae]|uniref:Uncharacterized protein n=1 Tax=Evansella alkalicola TaxID=745819 RepID=A0ABS6JZW5_9BACI|nr:MULTISPECIES: hypothetical protein [Bacillaceae]MBU9723757.1 hypothetical protein [Bacillus alkalicola]
MGNQDKLMDVFIDRLFRKHNISDDNIELSEDERERMRGIVENIQGEVEQFLENTEKKVTEDDMPAGLNTTNEYTEDAVESFQEDNSPLTKPKVYLQNKKKK